MNKLGDGMTAMVYHARKLSDHNSQVAIKILKKAYSDGNLNLVQKEVAI